MKPLQMYLQKNLVILAVTVSLELTIMCFSITPPSGHIDLELKNEKNIRPVLAKVPINQVSSESVQPFRNVPMMTTTTTDDGQTTMT